MRYLEKFALCVMLNGIHSQAIVTNHALIHHGPDSAEIISLLLLPRSFAANGIIVRLACLLNSLMSVCTSMIDLISCQIPTAYEILLKKPPLLTSSPLLVLIKRDPIQQQTIALCHIHCPFNHEPDFGATSVTYDLPQLWHKGETPIHELS